MPQRFALVELKFYINLSLNEGFQKLSRQIYAKHLRYLACTPTILVFKRVCALNSAL